MMCRELLHIWGPFYIYSYGLAIASGLLLFIWLILRDPKRASIVSQDKFLEITFLSLIVGVLGARILFALNSLNKFDSFLEFFAIWNGGLSMLGGLIALVIFLPWYLKKIHVKILPFLDLAALYAPILHAMARLGCFMAGCCYGMKTTLPWAILYTDPSSEAPLHIPLHPTQLYMALFLFGLFLFFYFYAQKKLVCSGQLFTMYLMAESFLRFTIDFFRGDVEYLSFDTLKLLSLHQWISLLMFSASLIGFIMVSSKRFCHKQQSQYS